METEKQNGNSMFNLSFEEQTFNTKHNSDSPTVVALMILVFTKTTLEAGVRIYFTGKFSLTFIGFH